MDMSLMRLAVRNLLGNALNALSRQHARVAAGGTWEEPAIVFEVEDQRSGHRRRRACQALPARRPRRTGAKATHGLGLYIVRRVLELHRGRAELARSSAVGLGAAAGGAAGRGLIPQTGSCNWALRRGLDVGQQRLFRVRLAQQHRHACGLQRPSRRSSAEVIMITGRCEEQRRGTDVPRELNRPARASPRQ